MPMASCGGLVSLVATYQVRSDETRRPLRFRLVQVSSSSERPCSPHPLALSIAVHRRCEVTRRESSQNYFVTMENKTPIYLIGFSPHRRDRYLSVHLDQDQLEVSRVSSHVSPESGLSPFL